MPRKPNLNKQGYRDPFPSALRKLMFENGITQAEIKDVLGLANRQSVTGYVDGSTAPTPEKIIALADYFGVSADYLLGRGELPNTTEESRIAAKYTGLSEKAVATLHSFSELSERFKGQKPIVDYVSALITSFSFRRLLDSMEHVETVIENIFDESTAIDPETGEQHRTLLDKEELPKIRFAVFESTQVFMSIIDELFNLDELSREAYLHE